MFKFMSAVYWIYAAVLVAVIVLGILSLAGVFSTNYDGPSL
jgi:hypothetical protein